MIKPVVTFSNDEQVSMQYARGRQGKSLKVDEVISILCASICLLTLIPQINRDRCNMQLFGADSKH